MPPAARVTDMHNCPMVTGVVPHVGGPILPPGHPTTIIGGFPAARVGDLVTCAGPPDTIVRGSPTVLICNMPAARMGDNTAHGGVITMGHPTTIIGDAGSGGGGGGGGGAGPGVTPGGGGDEAKKAAPASSSPAPAPTSVQGATVAVQVQNRESAATGAALCEECQPHSAQAYTVGDDVAFAGQSGPTELLAHEAAHAAQQGAGGVGGAQPETAPTTTPAPQTGADTTDAAADLDAEIAAAPLTEEELGDNAPEFQGAMEDKRAAEEDVRGMPRYREQEGEDGQRPDDADT